MQVNVLNTNGGEALCKKQTNKMKCMSRSSVCLSLLFSLSLSLGLVRQLVNLHNFDMFFFFLCMYILAVWHDPGGLRGCLCLAGRGKKKPTLSQLHCTNEAPAPAPPDPKPPPSSAFINTSHYSSSSLHRNVKRGLLCPGQTNNSHSNTHVLVLRTRIRSASERVV